MELHNQAETEAGAEIRPLILRRLLRATLESPDLNQEEPRARFDSPANASLASASERDERLAQMGQALADLLSVVAEQQQQIENLRLAIEAASIAHVQVQVTRLAQEDFRQRIADAKEILPDIARAGGEFSVGAIEHRGTLTISKATTTSGADQTKTLAHGRDAKKVDVAAEIKGIASKLAGCEGAVAVDVSNVNDRVDSLYAERRQHDEAKIEGTFETRQTGSVFRFGK